MKRRRHRPLQRVGYGYGGYGYGGYYGLLSQGQFGDHDGDDDDNDGDGDSGGDGGGDGGDGGF